MRGPHEDIESYLEAVEQLRGVVQFFSGNKGFKSSTGVINQATNLLGKAILKLEEEYRQLLTAYRFSHPQQSYSILLALSICYYVMGSFNVHMSFLPQALSATYLLFIFIFNLVVYQTLSDFCKEICFSFLYTNNSTLYFLN